MCIIKKHFNVYHQKAFNDFCRISVGLHISLALLLPTQRSLTNKLNESRCLSFYFAWSIATTVVLIVDSVDYDIAFNFLRMKVQLLLFSPNFSNFTTGLIPTPW